MKQHLLLVCMMFMLAGCQTAVLTFPGKALNGTSEESAGDFSFAASHNLLRLEVRPEKPYSVILRCTVIDDAIYVDAAPSRKWGKFLEINPAARIQLGDAIYNVIAVRVNDPELTDQFMSGRTVYRLDPR